VSGKARTLQKRRLSSEEAKRLAEDEPWVQRLWKATEVQWKCRQLSGSGWKTAQGNWSVWKSAGRNWSEALGLRCWDKSGIGPVATTFLFRGCQKEGFGKRRFVRCSCQTARSCRRKSRSCWKFHGRPEVLEVA